SHGEPVGLPQRSDANEGRSWNARNSVARLSKVEWIVRGRLDIGMSSYSKPPITSNCTRGELRRRIIVDRTTASAVS
ncbi:MAG TPA: hypothetical protein VGA56_08265, partial [Opitutaceae bacterium]